MNERLIIALLSLIAIGSLAAVFVLWAKLDEQKQKTAEERGRRWDEISLSLNWEKSNAGGDQLLDQQDAFIEELITKIERQQDKLSSVLCPTNNHVWKDGFCTKCGRAQE